MRTYLKHVMFVKERLSVGSLKVKRVSVLEGCLQWSTVVVGERGKYLNRFVVRRL